MKNTELTVVVKTGIDSSNTKHSVIRVSITGTQR